MFASRYGRVFSGIGNTYIHQIVTVLNGSSYAANEYNIESLLLTAFNSSRVTLDQETVATADGGYLYCADDFQFKLNSTDEDAIAWYGGTLFELKSGMLAVRKLYLANLTAGVDIDVRFFFIG